jgi:hypothetical protein
MMLSDTGYMRTENPRDLLSVQSIMVEFELTLDLSNIYFR